MSAIDFAFYSISTPVVFGPNTLPIPTGQSKFLPRKGGGSAGGAGGGVRGGGQGGGGGGSGVGGGISRLGDFLEGLKVRQEP